MIQEMKREHYRAFTTHENETWRMLFDALADHRKTMVVDEFTRGIAALGLNQQIPEMAEINRRMKAATGWVGVPVEGLEAGCSFFPALARREYPVGNFIRDQRDLGYTPAPDIFHDLYGHLPFFMDGPYAEFCRAYGEMASRHLGSELKLKMLERFFWFTVEFGLMETPQGRRIFGAGIVSSRTESIYSLSNEPEVIEFDIDRIIHQDYRIDILQKRLFVMKSREQLYSCLPELERKLKQY